MALGVLGDIVFGLLDLFDIVGGERPHSWRFLIGAWLLVTSLAVAVWRWHAALLASFGDWAVLGAVVGALFALYLIGATFASIRFAFRDARSRPAS